jgi:hypothetical protein
MCSSVDIEMRLLIEHFGAARNITRVPLSLFDLAVGSGDLSYRQPIPTCFLLLVS